MKLAVILLGRGGYSDAPENQLRKLVSCVQETGRYLLVEGAMVDQGAPSLPEALDACAASEPDRILVVPVFMPDDRNLSNWLAKIVRRWMRKHEGLSVEIALADALGDQPALGDAVTQVVADAEDKEKLATDPRQTRFGDADWSLIPTHKAHVLTCRGPRCTTLGSGRLWNHLAERLHDEGLETSILVTQTGCLYSCNLGPVMTVYPEGVWYCGLTPEAIDLIIDKHFQGGQVAEEYARRPAPYAQQRPGAPL